MASPASTRPRVSFRRPPADVWPAPALERWLLRVAMALPFVLVALLSRGSRWQADSNITLAARGDLIRWGDTDLGWIARVFPPLSSGLASVLRGNELAFHLVAAAVIGLTLQRLTGALVRKGLGAPATVAVMSTLALTAPLYYLASTSLEQVLGVALLILALDRLASFVEHGSTEAGFRAGLALGVAVMVEPAAWLYVLTLAAVAPFFAARRTPPDVQDRAGVQGATIAVLVFPAVAALAFWLYLSWWFSSDPLGGMAAAPVDGWFPGGVAESALHAARQIGLALLVSPLFLVAFAFRVRREPRSLVAPLIAVVGLFASLWLGLRAASGLTYIVLTALYVLLLAVRRPSPRRKVVIIVAALAQLTLAWVVVLAVPGPLGDWVRVVVGL